jgi:hypothetical protein
MMDITVAMVLVAVVLLEETVEIAVSTLEMLEVTVVRVDTL